MLNIQLSDRYVTAHDLLLEEEGFHEEVVVEASDGNFHLTCSIGIDKRGGYVTWNLRYQEHFLEHKTLKLKQLELDVFNRQQLLNEAQFKFRQLLWKTANRSGEEATAAKKLINKWTYM